MIQATDFLHPSISAPSNPSKGFSQNVIPFKAKVQVLRCLESFQAAETNFDKSPKNMNLRIPWPSGGRQKPLKVFIKTKNSSCREKVQFARMGYCFGLWVSTKHPFTKK